MKIFSVIVFAACAAGLNAQPAAAVSESFINELVLANHILANEDVLDGYGHVSVRSPTNPNHYFLARAGAPLLVTAADIIEYDLDSKPVTNTSASGYMERFIHGEIYKARPDVMAVIHCHCPEVIPFADTGVPLQPMHHMGGFIGAGVPVFEIRKTAGDTDMLIRSPLLGSALALSLGGKSAVLMRGHGAAVVGPTLHIAVGRAYYLNLNARLQLQAMQLGGKVTFLDAEESRQATTDFERSWDAWKHKVTTK